MRKVVLSIVSVVTIGFLAGCGAPRWVEDGTGVQEGKASTGIYGVGEGMSELSPEAQSNFASIKARSALNKAETTYVEKILKMFVHNHEDWFVVEEVSKLGIYSKVAEAVADETLLDMEKVAQWTDKKGSKGEAGTLYMLRYLPLDTDFFDMLKENCKTVIQDNADKILKVESDTVMEGLDDWIAQLKSNPLMSEMESEPEKKAEEASETDKEEKKTEEASQ